MNHTLAPATPALDNMTLSRKEGWNAFVGAGGHPRPETLTLTQLQDLSEGGKAAYDRTRRKWHANLGPIKTPQLAALHDDLWDITDANDHDGDKAKGAIAIDAFPGLGKTTSVLAFAKAFQQRETGDNGQYTSEGNERLPVCRVGLTGNTGMKDLNRAMLDFFGHPGVNSGTTSQLSRWALDCVLSCRVKIIIIDDLHFLRWGHSSGVEVSNHFKHIANEFPVTLLLIGVGLAKRGLSQEGQSYEDAVLAQTARRTTRLGMQPFLLTTDEGRTQWRQLMLAIEQRIVLAGKHPGMLADDLSDYLFARSTGHIGSLMTLVNRGCQRAIRTGAERLSTDLLDRVRNTRDQNRPAASCKPRWRLGNYPANRATASETAASDEGTHLADPRGPGEALDSWLEAISVRLNTPLRTLIGPFGLARHRLERLSHSFRSQPVKADRLLLWRKSLFRLWTVPSSLISVSTLGALR